MDLLLKTSNEQLIKKMNNTLIVIAFAILLAVIIDYLIEDGGLMRLSLKNFVKENYPNQYPKKIIELYNSASGIKYAIIFTIYWPLKLISFLPFPLVIINAYTALVYKVNNALISRSEDRVLGSEYIHSLIDYLFKEKYYSKLIAINEMKKSNNINSQHNYDLESSFIVDKEALSNDSVLFPKFLFCLVKIKLLISNLISYAYALLLTTLLVLLLYLIQNPLKWILNKTTLDQFLFTNINEIDFNNNLFIDYIFLHGLFIIVASLIPLILIIIYSFKYFYELHKLASIDKNYRLFPILNTFLWVIPIVNAITFFYSFYNLLNSNNELFNKYNIQNTKRPAVKEAKIMCIVYASCHILIFTGSLSILILLLIPLTLFLLIYILYDVNRTSIKIYEKIDYEKLLKYSV